ncbi:MAG: PorV/PorQ family protein [Bacteroidales bacterium]|nr:PorV/PorQ family protein [Bacteroidales bacterium]
MKNFYKYLIAFITISFLVFPILEVSAGNKDRSGQAGAAELLIDPWARSSGWGGVNIANVTGLEGMFNNVAGIAHTPQTELIFSYTDWLKGADISVMSFGITQRVSESGVFGLSVMSMNFGDIEITTIDNPEGGIGMFSPRYLNFALSYGKAFSNSIFGGLTLKVINESIADASAQGIAIDAGIQYITGEQENIKFGISLRNIGPKMQFKGDGYSLTTFIQGNDNQFTTTQRGASFELPTQLNIGVAYDFLFEQSRFTLAGSFFSNSFTKDQFSLGGEFSFRDYVQLRAAYTYEDGIFDEITNPERSNANKGLSAGFTVQVPLNKEIGSVFAVDYSYRPTDHFDGIHAIGARFTL